MSGPSDWDAVGAVMSGVAALVAAVGLVLAIIGLRQARVQITNAADQLREVRRAINVDVVGRQNDARTAHHALLLGLDDAKLDRLLGGLSNPAMINDRVTALRAFSLCAVHLGRYESLFTHQLATATSAGVPSALDGAWVNALEDFVRIPLYALYWSVDSGGYASDFRQKVSEIYDDLKGDAQRWRDRGEQTIATHPESAPLERFVIALTGEPASTATKQHGGAQ